MIKTYFILFIVLLFLSCREGPASSNNSPTTVNYLPMTVGNQWIYNTQLNVVGGYGVNSLTDGTELWEIVSSNENDKKFRLKCEFNGIKKNILFGEITDSVKYEKQISFFDIDIVEGPDSLSKSMSIVMGECIDCENNYTILENLLKRRMISEYKFLEVSFPSTSDSLLYISHGPVWISCNYTLEYSIKKNLGIDELKLNWYCDGGGIISYELLNFNNMQ